MSSYHSSFSYLNKNSKDNFQWLIVHFEADQGETDSYLSQEQIYTDSYSGRKRLLYGTKWSEVANIKITVIKQNGSNFSVQECRDAYKWLTGNPMASWLDLYAGDKLQYSFLGTVQDVKPEKLDARTVGLNIYFESVSPWAYSPPQNLQYSFGQDLSVNNNGVLGKGSGDALLGITTGGVLYNGTSGGVGLFQITTDGVVYIDNSVKLQIDNKSDDLYSYINLETTFTNQNSPDLFIRNITLKEETAITGLSDGEIVTLSAGQFIISDMPNKIFGNSFNFIWPRLAPGINEFIIGGSGIGEVRFTYRYPIKIGDCVIDIYVSNDDCGCPDNTSYGIVAWDEIVDTPTTLDGYGITDVYTEKEIDAKLENINVECDTTISEAELNNMLAEVLGE
jgi:hypothetical protein